MTILLIFLAFIPSLFWLWFFLREDIHPEPKKLIFKIFIAGFLITFLVGQIQLIFNFFSLISSSFFSLLILATIEELFKFFTAYFIVRKSPYFDEPVDAMIYMITAALGFAAAENLLVVFSNFNNSGFLQVIEVLMLRFIGATLLHALSSAIVGFYWAKKFSIKNIEKQQRSAIFKDLLAEGLILASLLHAGFNYLIIVFNKQLIYSILFLLLASFFIFIDFEKLKKYNKI